MTKYNILSFCSFSSSWCRCLCLHSFFWSFLFLTGITEWRYCLLQGDFSSCHLIFLWFHEVITLLDSSEVFAFDYHYCVKILSSARWFFFLPFDISLILWSDYSTRSVISEKSLVYVIDWSYYVLWNLFYYFLIS